MLPLSALPTGPQRLNTRPAAIFSGATVGAHTVVSSDFVVADANGVLFLAEDGLDDIIAAAITCRETEARQLKAMREGRSFRDQVRFSEYIAHRDQKPGYTFREHLKEIEAAGEA